MVSWPLSGVACHTTCFSSSGLWLESLSDSSRNSTEILDVSLEFPPYLSCRKVSILEYLNPCGQNVWFKLRIGRSKTARQPICSLLPSLLISLAANWGSHVLVTSTLKGSATRDGLGILGFQYVETSLVFGVLDDVGPFPFATYMFSEQHSKVPNSVSSLPSTMQYRYKEAGIPYFL